MPFDHWKRRIESLGGVMLQRRCSCPPPEPVNVAEGDFDVVELPPIPDLPCPVCKGLRDVVYVLKVIKTTPIQSSDSQV
jgi:hypothetical protein